MRRDEFLKLCGGMMLATQLPNSVLASTTDSTQPLAELRDVRKIKIDVGATSPFSALHISDTHLTFADTRNDERKIKLAESRSRHFSKAEQCFKAAIRYAQERDLMLLHTGDLIDFVSEANIDYVAKEFRRDAWFVSSGNHEFSQYVGEAKEDAAYKQQSYNKVLGAYPNDLTFASRVINGVNFVAIDDVYYNITAEQHERMKREVERGFPIVMMCHVPLYTPEHCKVNLAKNQGKSAYMTGVPRHITDTYQQDPNRPASEQWRNRSVQQRADKPTLEFIAWLKEQPLLKAILCGHTHEFYQERFSPTAMQYTVAAGYSGCAYEIEFV
ncbi:MAG: metallophosphoesterase [Alistipes sp.]|nr:metallophosphoesterase [Alistipes sp.]MBO5331177.1 metallophosphoesterase [Alistipes sp.]MBP3601218.1 metallophosphoesterase [Alistipes sp.]